MRRTVIPELLDSDSGTPAEIATSMADLRRINRLFGGISTTQALLTRVVQATACGEFALLDVAAASGDVTFSAATRLSRRGIRIERTLLDRSPAHRLPSVPHPFDKRVPHPFDKLRAGSSPVLAKVGFQARQAATVDSDGVRVIGDALALPFADESFDLVTCSLFVHHLEPEQIVRFIGEALRVCRIAVLINDLRRSAVSLALTCLGLPLFRSRLTRHDAIASVRRAYTMTEIEGILKNVPTRGLEIRPHYLFRMGVIVWK